MIVIPFFISHLCGTQNLSPADQLCAASTSVLVFGSSLPVTHTVLTKQLITSTQVLNLWTQEIRLSSHPSSILHSPASSCHANPSFTVISVPSVTGFSTPFVMLLPTKFYTTKVSTFNEKNLSPFLWSQ